MTNISKLLAITKGDVISFVGAGGKTSLINALALSLRENFSVAITTTTHMYPVNDNRFQNHVLSITNRQSPISTSPQAVPYLYGKSKIGNRKSKIPVFFSSLDSEGKGLPPSMNDIKIMASLFDIVLIEADGARGKSLKIPRVHEPAVPDFSAKVVLVVGLDVLGKKISDDFVFHPEIFKDKGWGSDTVITAQVLRDILYAPNGYLDKLKGKEIYLVLNKSDLIHPAEKAFCTGRLMYHENIKSIILSGTGDGVLKLEPVDNSQVPVTGILLAAGRSLRYGSPKLVQEFNGKPLFSHSFKTANASKLDKLIVVVGGGISRSPAHIPSARGETGDELIKIAHSIPNNRAEFIRNLQPSDGISSSIKMALTKVKQVNPNAAAMIMLADMPNVTAELIDNVLKAFHNSAALISAPFYRDRSAPARPDGRTGGHPVIFHPSLFPELMALEGDRGGKEIILKHIDWVKKIPLASADSQLDIDTPIKRTY